METTEFFYLYLYPIVSSIVAGLIFWLIFSFLPDRNRKKSFGIGINNDLFTLNNQIFGYFDFFLRFQENSPSCFQDKIHSSSLTEEDLNTTLQNKIISKVYLQEIPDSRQMLVVGNKLISMVAEIDKTIDRLFSFNYFLSSREVMLLRNIHENIHRYMPYIQLDSNIHRTPPFPVDLSLAFMTRVLLDLQDNFRNLRKIIFNTARTESDQVIQKIQWQFYSGNYKYCIKECNIWINKFPFDSSLQSMYLIRCNFFLHRKNVAYTLLSKFLENNNDIVAHRTNLYPLLSDPIVCELISKKTSYKRLQEMKIMVENENLITKKFISSNMELKSYYRERGK